MNDINHCHKKKAILHFARNLVIGLFFIAIALFFGMLGYHYFEKMNWPDAFVNAAMILSGMGPISTLSTTGGKIFAGLYALFSGLAFIVLIAVIFMPLIHLFFRKIHLETRAEYEKNKREDAD